MNFLRSLIAGIALAVLTSGSAWSQCGTTAPANKVCGNNTGSQALAQWITVSPGGLTPIAGGTVLGNPTGASAVPVATVAPVLGIPGTSTGQVGLAGSSSGTAVLRAQGVAGSGISLLPTLGGTLAGSASSPLVLNATTGLLTCPTCATSSGGGAITGTAPIAVSAAGVVSINAPYVTLTASNGGILYSGATNLAILAGTATARQMLQSGATAAPAWSTATWPATTAAGTLLASASANTVTATSTPVLGVAGTTVGSLGFQNATSGTVTLQPVTGALGAATLSLPATTDTLVGKATTDTFTNKTFDTAATGNSLLINGLAATANTGTGAVVRATSPSLVTPALGVATATSLALGGAAIGSNALAVTGTTQLNGAATIASNSAQALTAGPNGATNPAFQVDASASSAATGIKVVAFAAGSGSAMTTVSSGTNENMAINAKGTGLVTLGNVSSGGVQLGTGGGGVAATALTVNTSFTATGLVGYSAMASAAVATGAQYLSGAASVLVPASVIYQAPIATTFGATTTFDFSTFIDTAVTMTGNITTQTLTNVTAGKAGTIAFVQDSTGSRTTVWNSIFKFAGGVAPILTTTANALDILSYDCRSATFCQATLMKDVR